MVEGTIARWKKKQGDTIEMGTSLPRWKRQSHHGNGSFRRRRPPRDFREVTAASRKSEKSGPNFRRRRECRRSRAPDKANLTTAAKPAKPRAPAPTAPPAAAAAPSPGARAKASPLARKIAAERGVGLDALQGSGPGGRIVAKDIRKRCCGGRRRRQAPHAAPKMKPPQRRRRSARSSHGMRRVIAERLLASKTQLPHFYLSIEVDASALMRLRKELNTANETAGCPS